MPRARSMKKCWQGEMETDCRKEKENESLKGKIQLLEEDK